MFYLTTHSTHYGYMASVWSWKGVFQVNDLTQHVSCTQAVRLPVEHLRDTSTVVPFENRFGQTPGRQQQTRTVGRFTRGT